jgi:D123
MYVYIDRKDRIWLIHFNVWATQTDALLFHWSELLDKADILRTSIDTTDYLNDDTATVIPPIKFRIVESLEQQIMSIPLSNYKVPIIDVLHMSASSSSATDTAFGNTNKFQDFMKMCERPSVLRKTLYSDDSDDENEPRF